jgi:hypothetical protein
MKKLIFAALVSTSCGFARAQEAPPPEETAAPAVPGDVCADGKPHTFRLQENRDRLLATLAAEKKMDSCALWGSLSLAERDIFEMVTAYLGSCESRLAPPPSTSDETVLDLNHALKLYSINGPGLKDITASPVPSGGGACGGYNSNRVFMGFDQTALDAMREIHGKSELNPKKVKGYNAWRKSNDPGGPHKPFSERDMICWGGTPCWLPDANSEGPTWHFFAKDGDLDPAGLRDRRGVCGVADPHLVELTIAFNWDHESDPLCGKDWPKEVVDKIGHANFRTYKPNGTCDAPPISIDPASGKDHGEDGLGPDQLNGTCLASPPPAASAAATQAAEAVERVETETLP